MLTNNNQSFVSYSLRCEKVDYKCIIFARIAAVVTVILPCITDVNGYYFVLIQVLHYSIILFQA